MDSPISKQVLAQQRKKYITLSFMAIAVLVASVFLVRTLFKSTITRSEITTAIVETGNIENTINASGEILPEFEEVLTSPVNASIKGALIDAGSRVNAGQSILTLDKSATENEFNKLKFQLETKRNEITKLKLNLDKSFFDIQSSNAIKQLRISSLKDAVESAKRLFKAGGGTREDIEQAELSLKVAGIEKMQLENEIKSKQQTMRVEKREAEIAAQIQQNDLKELARKLNLANVIATRSGVVTFVNKNIGASIKEGETLARIADLGSFKISANISEDYMEQLRTNMPVIVKVNDSRLRGHVSTIYPSILNGIVSFDVALEVRNNPQLKPNMKVEVFLITASRNRVTRVTNGPAFKGTGKLDVFVINKNKAERRTVNLGMSNFDYVEILQGLNPGEVVISSDLSEYRNSKELSIK